MSNITKVRRKLDSHKAIDLLVTNDIEIGPIKIEQDTSTESESNEEAPETPAKNVSKMQQDPKTKLQMSSEKTKKRGKNFSAEEELILVELVEERKDVLNNKKSDAITWRHKEEAWAELADNFIAKTGVLREWRQLRDKFLHMKRKARVELAMERAQNLRSGAEPALPAVSTVSEKIVAMIGDGTTGIKKAFDSDASTMENELWLGDEDDLFEPTMTYDNPDSNVGVSEDDQTSNSSKWATGNVRLPTVQSQVPGKPSERQRSLEEEKLKLLQLQQNFCRCENARAQEKHEMEMLERRSKGDDEARERRLRIELLEIELKQKRAKLDL